MDYTKEEIVSYFKSEYKTLSNIKLEILYDQVYETMRNLRYPFNNEIIEIPKEYMQAHKTWIFRVMEDILERNGIPKGVVAYSENGVSIQFEKSGIPKDLLNEIIPLAKIGRGI